MLMAEGYDRSGIVCIHMVIFLVAWSLELHRGFVLTKFLDILCL